jgi:hypothetical protein
MQSLSSSLPAHSAAFWMGDDEEAGLIRHDNDELGKLLADERRLTQLLHGPQNRSAKLIGRSNPRYRWEQYWRPEEELDSMPKHL